MVAAVAVNSKDALSFVATGQSCLNYG